MLIKNAAAILPERKIENVSLLIEGETIVEILDKDADFAAYRVFDLENSTLQAGFIDIHIHGAIGIDVNDASAAELDKISAFLASNGITAWLPSLVPDSDKNYRKSIGAIEELMEMQKSKPVAQALGVHYEGVFANEKMCGALRPEFFKTFKYRNEIGTLPKIKSENAAHLTTLAPEVENGIDLIEELIEQNWVVSIGHTRADAETLERAKRAGAKHLTHFFNAMSGIHHRDLGVAGWGLSDDDISFDIIADGIHVQEEMLRLACRNKPIEKVTLISDAVAPTGLGDGEFELWGEKISVANGRTRNERGSIAGSVITMLDAVKRMLSLGFSECEVSQMASANPAKLLGVEKTRGSIEVGKRADLVALDADGNVKLVLIGGNVAFRDV